VEIIKLKVEMQLPSQKSASTPPNPKRKGGHFFLAFFDSSSTLLKLIKIFLFSVIPAKAGIQNVCALIFTFS